jgi:POT family proton-dependent oligopeptide transporter
MYPLWAERTLDLHVAGMRVPVTWLQSVDAAASSSAIVASLLFWRWWARRWAEPDDITKMVLGTGLMVLAPLVLALASWRFAEGGARVSLAWVLPYEGLTALGIMNFMPVGLGLYARAAPASISATMIGAFYLNVFLANVMVGWAGGYLDRVSGEMFWGWHAGVTAVAGVVLVWVRGVVGRVLG